MLAELVFAKLHLKQRLLEQCSVDRQEQSGDVWQNSSTLSKYQTQHTRLIPTLKHSGRGVMICFVDHQNPDLSLIEMLWQDLKESCAKTNTHKPRWTEELL